MTARMYPLGGVGPIAVVILVAACGGNSTSGETDTAGGTGGSANGSGALAGEGGNGDSGSGDGSGGTSTGGRSSTGGESTAGAQNRGGAGETPMPPRGGTSGEAGAPDDPPMPGAGSSNAGAGGEGTVIPPAGCSVRFQSSDAGSCDLGLKCGDNEFLQTHCVDMMIDVWQCGCQGGSEFPSYNLGHATELDACRAMAELCRSGTAPNPIGPVECGPKLEMRAASSCQIRQACTQEIEGHTDATWALLDETYCDDDGTGRLSCSCSNSGWSYYLENQDGTTACDVISEFCQDPVEPDFEAAEWECRPQFESSASGSCETHSSCTLTATVGDGITVPVNSWVDVKCQSEATGSTCTCNGPPGEFRIDSDEPVEGIASCTNLSTFCLELGEVEFSGDSSCTNVGLTTQEGSCEAQLQCGASATVNGKQVKALRPVGVSCLETDGSWSCACNSDAASTTVPGEGSDPWDVCISASDACADAVFPP